ncbi:DNA polymerase sliding clamp subunit (PCNA-like) [Pyrobaculum oguniense TE7]|uniref:DNA polymerase sliding clamp n=1 Tax=Pyrobaculum oguniense (strain DSM 13380 / JCM 10595 / TE7) TaxID=698757 RepID=H6QDQ8_PYROT|nr:DNA polymerase sliding clamp subunit (PCNA-like) [Pyrobaculum oguniense TE7]
MSVRALFPKGKEPRYVFEVLIGALPEAVLNFSHDGISLKALDPTKTALFELMFHATALEDYSVEEETKVGIIFTTLKDVLKRIGATEKLEIGVDKDRNRFSLYVYPKKGKDVGLVRRFSFPVVQAVEEEIPELPLSFDASFEMDADVFDDVVAMVEEVSDWIEIRVGPDSVTFRGVGEGGKAAEAEFTHDSDSVFSISADNPVSAKYSVEMLRDISRKMKSLSKRVKIELSLGKPIRLSYEFATGIFTATIAPRVD